MTPDRPIRHDLLDVTLRSTPTVARTRITRVELAPGQAAGRHRHPCDVIGYVVSGAIAFEIAGKSARRLAAGDAFHEPRDVVIERFDNASGSEPAAFVACYLLGPGETEVIEML